MKTFESVCAQGDVLVRRVSDIPHTAVAAIPDRGRIVVTHSETGHDHVMVLDDDDSTPAVEMFNCADNPLISWLRVNRPTALEHLRPHDTHEPILFQPGAYEVRRQREHTPEGWRQVVD